MSLNHRSKSIIVALGAVLAPLLLAPPSAAATAGVWFETGSLRLWLGAHLPELAALLSL